MWYVCCLCVYVSLFVCVCVCVQVGVNLCMQMYLCMQVCASACRIQSSISGIVPQPLPAFAFRTVSLTGLVFSSEASFPSLPPQG